MKKKQKNGIFYVVISFVAILAIGSMAVAYSGYGTPKVVVEGNYIESGTATVVGDESLGGNPGGYFNTKVFASEGVVTGGRVYNASTTLLMAREITATEICNSGTITVNSAAVAATLSAASLDLTMAATSTLFAECLRNDGDQVSFDFLNQSPTAASTTEMVQGAGCTQVIGVADGDDLIPGQKGATITIKRVTDWLADGGSSDCVVRIYEWN